MSVAYSNNPGNGRKGNWMTTFSGLAYYPIDPRADEVRIEDIAHALSYQCRYGGHSKKFYCVSPETKILTKDMRWVPAGSLRVGDELLGIEETANMQKNKKRTRKKMLPSVVLHDGIIKRPRYEITLGNGDVLVSSSDHPWLVAHKASGNQRWVKTETLFADFNKGNTRYFPKYLNTWEAENTRASGWLAGIFDGEGSVSSSSSQIAIAQKPGTVLDMIVAGVAPYTTINCTMHASGVVQCNLHGAWADKFEFLGRVRPARLLENVWQAIVNRKPTAEARELVKVVGMKYLGVGDVVALETSTHTYFAEGYAAHNSVAEHSVLMARYFRDQGALPHIQLQALLHDATEAYVCDVPRPLKPSLTNYKEIEARNRAAICQALDLHIELPAEVEDLDYRMPLVEMAQLMPESPMPLGIEGETPKIEVLCWEPDAAERVFLATFNELWLARDGNRWPAAYPSLRRVK